MKLLRLLAPLLLLFAASSPAAAADLILSQAGDHIIEARINNVPVRLRVDPETSGFIILNGAAAARIGLRPSMIGARTVIGPVRVSGSTKVADVEIGGRTGDRRVLWTDRVSASDADGLIGLNDLPMFDRVTLQLGPPAAGERTFTLPMRYDRSLGLHQLARIGGTDVRFRISTVRPNSMATAAAGALFATHHGGAWSGPAGEQMIKYEVVRPVRPMRLAAPFALAGLPVRDLVIRTSDSRGNAVLPPDAEVDPDEIVVTGERERQRARYDVSLGLDWLAGCSSLTWDNRARTMTLSCLPR